MRNHLRTKLALWCSLLLLVCLPACASFNEMTGPTAVPGVVASIDIPTTQTKLAVGNTLALQAMVYDGSRNVVVDKSVLWTSSDTNVARVSREGVVTGVGVGSVRVAASAQGRSAVANLTVTARAVASILVNPPSPNILVGATLQLSSVTLGESGDVLANRAVSWQSSNPIVASIDNFGLLTGLAAGVTTITATSESRNASVGVTVIPVPVASVQISPATDTVVVGQTTQLTAVPRDSIGAPLTDRPVSWSSSNQQIATVSASGLVVGNAAGTVNITSSSENKNGVAKIVVLARPVGAVIVSPAQVSINAGQTLKLTVLITDNNGTLLTGRPISYKSGNTSIATVASDGTVTGVNEGSTVITVTSELKTGTADVDVAASPIATVRINTPSTDMAIGATQKLTVTLLDAAGTTLPARPISWRSGATSIATVASDGTVTALSGGTAVIFATVEGRLASTSISVRAITVSSVVVAPQAANIFVGDALDIGAQARDVAGNVIAGRAVLWTSSNDAVAVVSSTGRVRALTPGQALITATVDGIHASSAITTQIEPVLSVTLDPPLLNLQLGSTATLVAVARGRNGAPLPNRTITFQSSDPTVASVNSSGTVTALKTGSTTITASSETRQASIPVNVSPIPVATVAVRLNDPSRYVTQTTQASADVRDANGNVLSGRPTAWTSSNTNVATVSTTGIVTAVAPGTSNITATVEGKAGSAVFTVALVPVSTVNVSLGQSARFVGQTTQASAATLDSIGGTLTNRTIVWTSSKPAIASVTPGGLVTAIAPGTADIIATVEGKVGTAQITITLVPVAKVVVVLGQSKQFTGQSTQATVTLLDASDNVLSPAGRTITYASSDASVATVSSTGLVTTVAAGATDISATSEGKTGLAPYTVTIPPVATVAITLQQATRFTSQTTQADVVLRDPLGRLLSGRTITYSSSDPAIATVSATGLVTALTAGTATITALSEGISASTGITITPIPVSSVTLTAPQLALQPGQTTLANAVLKDINGVTLSGRTITWVSSNTAAATVSGTGLITAVASGTTNITATSEGVSAFIQITVTLVPVSAISVSIDNATIFASYTAQVTSVTRDVNGNILSNRLTTWSSSDQNVATVSAGGVVTGLAKGTASITGTSEGVSASVSVTVDLAPVAFVSISLTNTSLLQGQSTQATVSTSDINNRLLSGRVVTYSSSNTNVATVSASGAVLAIAAGSANIIATSEGKSDNVTVVVTAVPVVSVNVSLSGNSNTIFVAGTIQAVADPRDGTGASLPGRAITWSTGDASVATVDANGLVTGTGVGATNIIAQSEGKTGQVQINVALAPVASVTVLLGSTSIATFQTTTATAVLRDANNHILTNRVVTWQSSNSLVAGVGPNGGILGLIPGSATITATSEGISGSAGITVTLIPVNSIDVSLAAPSVVVGNTNQATAIPRDAGNGALTGRTITWSTSNPSIATVDANGLVTTIAPGAVDVIAMSEGKSGMASMTVSPVPPAPVASVSVALNANSVVAGQPTAATAATRDAANALLTGRVIAWSSSNAAVATVDQSGNVTTLTAGTTDITAASEGKSGFATLTVTAPPPAPVANVTVTMSAPSVVVGATSQATAVLTDASSHVLSGRVIVWSTSDATVATVDNNGLVTTIKDGSVTITATSEGKSGSAPLAITPIPVANVSVSLGAASVAVGQTTQATAAVTDANGGVLSNRVIVWSSSDNAIATVSPAGVVTAVAAGSATITATVEGKSGSAPVTVP